VGGSTEQVLLQHEGTDAEERTRHKQLQQELTAQRKDHGNGKGLRIQAQPRTYRFPSWAEWVGAEKQVLPFFDFHIDLEREGNCSAAIDGEKVRRHPREFGVGK